jgi:hypothetical protein
MITKTQIKKWNDYFTKLSKSEQSVAIAKDVIKQIKAEKYTPTSGWYIRGALTRLDNEADVQTNLNVSCNCCALGASLLSTVKYKNTLKIEDLYGYNEKNSQFTKMLDSIFTTKQQALIEASFEDGLHLQANLTKGFRLSEKDYEKCRDFYKLYNDPEDRLIGIMNNIIKNKGVFKP